MAYGRPNMGGMNQKQMMKQAQKLQEQMLAAQARLGEMEYTASTGGGAVKVTVTASSHWDAEVNNTVTIGLGTAPVVVMDGGELDPRSSQRRHRVR